MWSLFINMKSSAVFLIYSLYIMQNPWFTYNKLNILSEISLSLNNILYNYTVLLIMIYCLFLRVNSVILFITFLVCSLFLKKQIIIASSPYYILQPLYNITSTLLIGLLNIHPILFYISTFSLVSILLNCIRMSYKYKFYQSLNILSLLPAVTGSYWNYTRTNFNSWWTWDPIELVLSLCIILWLIYIHNNQYSINSSKKTIVFLLLFLSCVFITYSIRKSLLNSQHSFFNPSVVSSQEAKQKNIQNSLMSLGLSFFMSLIISSSNYYWGGVVTELKLKKFIFNAYNIIIKFIAVLIIIFVSVSIFVVNVIFHVDIFLEFISYSCFVYFFVFMYLNKFYPFLTKGNKNKNTTYNHNGEHKYSVKMLTVNFLAHTIICVIVCILFLMAFEVSVKKNNLYLCTSSLKDLVLNLVGKHYTNIAYSYNKKTVIHSSNYNTSLYFYNISSNRYKQQIQSNEYTLFKINNNFENFFTNLVNIQINLSNDSFIRVFDLVYESLDIVLSKSTYFTSLNSIGMGKKKQISTLSINNYCNFDIYSFDNWLDENNNNNNDGHDFYYSLDTETLFFFENELIDKKQKKPSIKSSDYYNYEYLSYNSSIDILVSNLNKKKSTMSANNITLYQYPEYFLLQTLLILIFSICVYSVLVYVVLV